jgi:hypothetical protein
MRDLRQPPDQASFDQRSIPVMRAPMLPPLPWYRLYQKEFAEQFYPSKGSRLTPLSGAFPCVYLAHSAETTVAEVWGDRLAAHRATGAEVYVISGDQAKRWGYLKLKAMPADLKICDLFAAETRLAIGIESGTLYAPDLSLPQTWAERIARHPAGFDGIRYRSRHTDEACLVLWSRPTDSQPLAQRIEFESVGEFIEADAAYLLAGKIGIRLAFAW